MRECPALVILATSREALRVTGEVRVGVRTLLIEEEAVPLFVDRARAAKAEFQLTSGNAQAVTTVCRRLDGIPLAIELAATWVTVDWSHDMLSAAECALFRRLACGRHLDRHGPAPSVASG
jgi:predicted ATPase